MEDRSADIAIVGSGIAGLAHAYMALRKGYRVVLFEREQFPVGASVRNFGLLWPIGQAPGVGLKRALRARYHWGEVAKEAGFWINENGSLHAAYHDDEWEVLQEFYDRYQNEDYQSLLLTPQETLTKSPAVKKEGLRGSLWSATEATVYAREAVRQIALWLVEKYALIYKPGHVVVEIALPVIKTARASWHVQKAIVCSGADFETLYPAIFDKFPMTKCKLQMMKAIPDKKINIGPTLCAGLTLRHYQAFAQCKSLAKVNRRYDEVSLDFKRYGIHVLLGQNENGELIIGDSHMYGKTVEPFDEEKINHVILAYLKSFTAIGDLQITERWHGIYPKLQGGTDLILRPESGVTIVNGLGGAGMTLSFGIAEEVIDAVDAC
jgi:D-hydroxyproline dehydrogenase subunit beta